MYKKKNPPKSLHTEMKQVMNIIKQEILYITRKVDIGNIKTDIVSI